MTRRFPEWVRETFNMKSLALFFFALALYATTLAPGVMGGDAGELQFTPSILALPHPSGYPIQLLLNRLFLYLVPFGSIAWRLNLLSALAIAAAVALVGRAVAESSHSRWAGLCVGAGLALAPVLWSQAVLADKYALTGLLTALVVALGSRFYRQPTARSLSWLAFAVGLALAHHRSLALLAPFALGLVMLRGLPLLRHPSVWIGAGLLASLPFLAYLYLPWAAARGLPPGYPQGLSWPQFLRYVFVDGSSGQVQLRPDGPGLTLYLSMLGGAFPSVWLVWMLGGLWLRWWQQPARRGWQILLIGSFLLTAYLSAVYENYDLPRRFVYFVPSYIFIGLMVGEGLAGYLGWRPKVLAGNKRWLGWLRLLWLGLMLLPMLNLPERWAAFRAEQYNERPLDIWRQTLKNGGMADRLAAGLALVQPGAFVVADWEQATPLWYGQLVEGLCPDCTILQNTNELVQVAAQARSMNRPLYVARTINGTETWSHPNSAGLLVWLAQEPVLTLPPGLMPLGIVFDEELALMGYTKPLDEPTLGVGTVLPISFVWKRTGVDSLPPYALSLRLYAGDQALWKADNPHPVLGMHPFSTFRPGEVVTDYYEIPLPADGPPGEYVLRVLLYENIDSGGFRNAQASDRTGNGLGEEVNVLRFQLR